jgi:hypothetical protein
VSSFLSKFYHLIGVAALTCSMPAYSCGGPGYRALLVRAPEDVQDGEVLAEVIVQNSSRQFTNIRRFIPVRILRVIKGDIDETHAIIDFRSESSCEFLGSTNARRFLVAHGNRGRDGKLYLSPVFYAERWEMISGSPQFKGMEREDIAND